MSILKASLDHTLKIGKYKGSVLRNVINTDPEYIQWMRDKEILKLDSTALCELINAKSKKLYRLSSFCDKARRS